MSGQDLSMYFKLITDLDSIINTGYSQSELSILTQVVKTFF